MKFGQRIAGLDLTPPLAGILRAISGAEGMSQKALGERLGIVPSRLVELLDELDRRGLVERRDDENDRRVYALYLTKKGGVTLEAVGRIAREHQETLLAALTSSELELLTSLLAKVADEQRLTPGVHPGYAYLRRARRSREDPGAER
jgi:DNA-binding MarR family transcriptional regulator